MKKHKLINAALELRKNNFSLDEISKKLNISKSIASLWLKNTPKKKISDEGKKLMLNALKRGRENSLKNRQLIPLDKLKYVSTVRERLFKKRGRICEICGWSKPNPFHNIIAIEMHHIDGNRKNNSEENLQVLCPNCHSLTKNYGFFGRIHKTSTRPKG